MISEYKILIKENATKLIEFAATELRDFISAATEQTLEIVREYMPGNKYISIDRTALSEKYVLTFPENFNSSGFLLRTIDNNYIIYGVSEHGSLYGVYELLKRMISFEAYAEGEIYFENKQDIAFEAIDFMYCPKIEYRHASSFNTKGSHVENINRLRLFGGGYNMDGNKDDWYYKFWGGGMFAHTTFKILPPERDENGLLIHKEWYNKEENQLCLTNEEMTKQFIDNLEKHIAKHADSPYFSVGIEDNSSFCNCEKCKASHDKYGGASGTYIRFVNRVAHEIDVWQKKELPNSRFKLVVFAYLWTKNPPVRYEGGKYLPYCDEMVFPDNVVIFNAPIDACGYHRLDEKCNKNVLDRFEKWQVYTKYSFVWDYHAYYDNVLLFFPGIWTYKSNISFYEKYNTIYMFNELQTNDFNTGFLDLKTYLLAKLSWDSSLDTDTLIKDFLKHYYKKSAGKMQEFLDFLKNHYRQLSMEYKALGARGYHVSYDVVGHPDVLTEKHWNRDVVEKMEKLLDEAAGLADDQTVLDRVKREQLFVKYLMIELHTYYCSKEELDRRMTEFKELVKQLGNVYNFAHWYEKGKSDPRSPHRIEAFYSRISCRYPARADQ